MSSKEDFIKNLREYSAAEIAQAVLARKVTLYELSKSGQLTPKMRRQVEELLENSHTSDSVETVKTIADEENINTELEEPTENIIESGETTSDIIDNRGMWKRPFSFKGRIRRTEYGLSMILACIWSVVYRLIFETPNVEEFVVVAASLSSVLAYWFVFAQGTKRCHDRGHSGFYQLIPFYSLVMLFGGSEEGFNEYGNNPKE
jgi:uncharacterized membrane protein YhaH (DUF805 family)